MKYWESIADKLSAAGWSWGYCEKGEVLAAFAAHKNEVTAGYMAK